MKQSCTGPANSGIALQSRSKRARERRPLRWVDGWTVLFLWIVYSHQKPHTVIWTCEMMDQTFSFSPRLV